MAETYKICPICNTPNHQRAANCMNCGTSLQGVEIATRKTVRPQTSAHYDFRYGETDLQETSLSRTANAYMVVLVAVLVVVVAVGGLIAFAPQMLQDDGELPNVVATNSPVPTMRLATVTPGPPTSTPSGTPTITFTPSITPTPAPCMRTVQTGSSLIGMIGSCGHRELDSIMPTVMALNNIRDAGLLQIGQEVVIPWPTATINPFITPSATPTRDGSADVGGGGLDTLSLFELDESIDAFAPTATSTLPPGVMWHQVNQGENLIAIAVNYNTNAKVLSELNPQIDFARCEFGERFGGPECLVQLGQGQFVRVPAPTPTPTLSPTPDPNATATPTPTPTFNEPSAFSPVDRTFFAVDELVTLRWIPSGTLSEQETYRVDVQDITTGTAYTAFTRDILFIVPSQWQGTQAARHEYRWTVGVVNRSDMDDIRFQTQPLIFFWQGVTTDG